MSIRRLDAATAGAAFAFLDTRVTPRGPAHWRWKYRCDGSGEAGALCSQDEAGAMLGFIGLMPTALHTASATHPAAWFVDWHVQPDQRALGVGLSLLRRAESMTGLLLTLQGSESTRQILPRLGWKQCSTPQLWVRPCSVRYLARSVRQRAPASLSLLSGVAAHVLRPLFRSRPARAHPDATLREIAQFPSSYDQTWQARRHEFAPLMTRDSAYLNYLCATYPDGGYRLQLLQIGGAPVGHLISRIDSDRHGLRRGRIIDTIWPRTRADLADWLVQSACRQLQESGADYIECTLAAPELAAAVRRQRFRCRGAVPIWYHRLPAGTPAADRWYITFLDCDRAYR